MSTKLNAHEFSNCTLGTACHILAKEFGQVFHFLDFFSHVLDFYLHILDALLYILDMNRPQRPVAWLRMVALHSAPPPGDSSPGG
jgi:hypothetical protein